MASPSEPKIPSDRAFRKSGRTHFMTGLDVVLKVCVEPFIWSSYSGLGRAMMVAMREYIGCISRISSRIPALVPPEALTIVGQVLVSGCPPSPEILENTAKAVQHLGIVSGIRLAQFRNLGLHPIGEAMCFRGGNGLAIVPRGGAASNPSTNASRFPGRTGRNSPPPWSSRWLQMAIWTSTAISAAIAGTISCQRDTPPANHRGHRPRGCSASPRPPATAPFGRLP